MQELYLNDTLLTNYIMDTPYSDTIDEELDKFNFQLKSQNRILFKKNDKIHYVLKQTLNNVITNVIDKVFCLFDYVETYEGEYYLYQLTCLSPTKLLENVIINGMAETTPNQTLQWQVGHVVDKINAQLSFENNPLRLQVYIHSVYMVDLNVAGCDFLWDGQQTAREILQDICDKKDYLLIGRDFSFSNGNITEIIIDVIPRELQKNKILETNSNIEGGGLNEVNNVVKGYSISRDSEFNNGNIISLIKNGICKDNVQQTYLPARNDDMTIDDASDWHILTQEPIYSLNSVKVLVNIKNVAMSVLNSDQTVKYSISPLTMTAELDITEYIVEKDVYDTLPTKEQKKRLYFKRGEKGIYGLFKRYKENPLWSNKAMENIFADLSDNFPTAPFTRGNFANIVNMSYWGSFDNDYKTFTKATDMTQITLNSEYINYGGQLSDIMPSNFTYGKPNAYADYSDKVLFSVNYQPYCDSVVKIEKQVSVSGNSKNLSVLKNQSDRTIDASKYYDSQQALINRLGNEEMNIDAMFKGVKLWGLGDYMLIQSEKWTLTKRELSNYGNDTIKARLTFSKNYNASNSAINVNRDKRLYGIPLNQFVDRYLIIKREYMNDYSKLLLYSHDDFTLNQNESTSDIQDGYTVLDLIKIGNSDITDKVARCKDNFSVDIERTKYSSTIVNINLRYCDETGYRKDIHIKLLDDIAFNLINIADYSRLPFLPTTSINYGVDRVLQNVYKDKMERLIFVIKE